MRQIHFQIWDKYSGFQRAPSSTAATIPVSYLQIHFTIWDKYILQFETNTLVASELRAELLPFLFHIYSQMHIATAAAINNKLRQFLSFPHCDFFFNFNPSRIVCYLSNRSLLLRYKGKERESVTEWQWPTLSHNFYKDAKTMAHKYQGGVEVGKTKLLWIGKWWR